jgi:streptogramin lyase
MSVDAQELSSPTPAPSKTPTPEPSLAINDTASESPITITIEEPLTQADLSILTGNVQRPNGMIWFNNHLYAICTGDSTIYELDDTTASTRTYIWGVRNGHTLHAELSAQNELNLWVPDFQTNRLLLIERGGITTFNTELAGPWGIHATKDQYFLISNLQANNVVAVSRAGGESHEVISDLRAPTGITADERYIYVANTGSARRAIEWIEMPDTFDLETPVTELQPLVSGLQNTTGIVLAADGYLYFAYALGTRGVVGRVDPEFCRSNGGCTNDQVEIVVYTELAAPLAGLTLSPDMRLFVHTMFSPDIYWVKLGAADDQP